MSGKELVQIADFRNAWNKLVRSEDETKDMPVHPLGSFRIGHTATSSCRVCHRHYSPEVWFRYEKLCFGKRRWWFFGRWFCPRVPHFHVRCLICKVEWFESMVEKEK